jgi:murein DD-endopeptidase MepM/ murein hydrolase activator NlpD
MSVVIRFFALATIASAVMAAVIVLPTAPTNAAGPKDAEDFVIKVFPHETSLVEFSDTWGAGRSGGRRHAGTDIMSPKGSWIVAVDDGIVERLEWNRLSGWNIMIRHAGAWTSHYLHLDNDTTGTDDGEGGPEAAFAGGLAVGSFVKAGEVIGFVGDSGNAENTGSHTHFELHLDGYKVNPFPYLAASHDRKLIEAELARTME